MVNTICMIISVKLLIVYLEISCTCLGLFYNATVKAFNALILYSNGYDYLITEGKFYIPLYGLRNQYQR